MGTPTKWTNGKLVSLIRRHAGILSLVAEETGLTRQTLWERCKNNPVLAAAIKEVKERTLDLAEGTVLQAIQGDKSKGVGPDLATARWYLERQGKGRGFANKSETSFDEAQIEALVSSLGGDPEKFRAALAQFGVVPE